MSTGYYGLDHPNPEGRAGGRLRRVSGLRGVAHHITVNAPTSTSAEDVARWQSTQLTYVNGVAVYSGYNTLFDLDSTVRYWPDDRAPAGARGGNAYGKYNDILIHLSYACNLDTWERYVNWARGAYAQAAVERRRIRDERGIPLRLLSKAELDSGVMGDVTHARLDPSRRKDPGAIEDRYGKFSFEVLFGVVEGDELPPAEPPEVLMFGYLKIGDEGEDVVQLHHLLNEFLVATGVPPGKTPGIAPEDLTSDGELLLPRPQFTKSLASAFQHAVWRWEGWVMGRRMFAGEEGGSRVTVQALDNLVAATRGLQIGVLDLHPSTELTRSGVDLTDARAAAEWVRANAR